MAEDKEIKETQEITEEDVAQYSMDEPEGGAQATATEEEAGPQRGAVTYSDQEDDEDYKLRYPRLRLLQSTSEMVRQGQEHAGKYVVDNFGSFDEPELIPMGRGLWRERRLSREEDPERPVVCFSNDGKTAAPGGNPGGSCAACPFLDKQCAKITSYICYMPEIDIPVRWDLRGGGRFTAEDLNTLIKVRGFKKFVVKAGKREAGEKDQRYLVPTVTLAEMPEGDLTLPALTG